MIVLFNTNFQATYLHCIQILDPSRLRFSALWVFKNSEGRVCTHHRRDY
jgi:hypothetical protein